MFECLFRTNFTLIFQKQVLNVMYLKKYQNVFPDLKKLHFTLCKSVNIYLLYSTLRTRNAHANFYCTKTTFFLKQQVCPKLFLLCNAQINIFQ